MYLASSSGCSNCTGCGTNFFENIKDVIIKEVPEVIDVVKLSI